MWGLEWWLEAALGLVLAGQLSVNVQPPTGKIQCNLMLSFKTSSLRWHSEYYLILQTGMWHPVSLRYVKGVMHVVHAEVEPKRCREASVMFIRRLIHCPWIWVIQKGESCESKMTHKKKWVAHNNLEFRLKRIIFIQRTENLTKNIFTKRKIRNPSVRLKINTKQLGTKILWKPPLKVSRWQL